jgi:uncharacterized membrane protein YdcZ (DUF606 family)
MAYNEGYTTAEVTSICVGIIGILLIICSKKQKTKQALKASKQKNIFFN